MVRRPKAPPERRPANLTSQQMNAAIPKLERRLRELGEVEITGWNDDVQNSLDALQTKVEDTLVGIFGSDTLEYKRFEVAHFAYRVSMSTMGTPPQEWAKGYGKAISSASTTIRTAIDVLKEKLEDLGETPEGQALQAYQGLELHPEIDRAAGKLFRDGHFANAIENAVKALNALVRLRSGVENLDGTKLMEHVFSPKNSVLRFNDLTDQTDQDEQRGFMMLFSGAVVGLRNPRAHKLIDDDPERALEFIAFVSLLAKLLDGAEKT